MIGSRVKEIRTQKHISLTQLAERSKITKSYLSNLERNICVNPTIDIVQKLADGLGVSPVSLIGWRDTYKERDSISSVKNEIIHMELTQLEELKKHVDLVIFKKKKLPLGDFHEFL
ncbi:helix-turn-helix domain-containing protein [Priestia flexa]|uniref:helix-turn-helix domain-containing protein n=1 Tax=Priestia flexa TaxID=86664 RepID=UPI00203D5C50|nr:helix-turn-helix transcriptional regulator [Priestia flexa]MCM3067781.1 helix-turn-helix domain-containing protein [Priestia flexa]